MLTEFSAAVEHEFCPPAVQCEFKAPPDLLEKDGLARPVVDVENLGVLIGELGRDQVDDNAECAGKFLVRACDGAHDLPRVVGFELGLDWSGRVRL